jgi:peptide deformylase
MGTPSDHAPLAERVEELLAGDGPLPIVAAGDPVLRRGTELFDGQLEPALLARFVEALRVTLHAAPGVGLAAPQVGVPLRIAVIEDAATVPEEVRLARGRCRSRSGCWSIRRTSPSAPPGPRSSRAA